MQSLDQPFPPDGGGVPPKGSRLAKYMAPRAVSATPGVSIPSMNVNVPSFVPSFAKMSLGDGPPTHLPPPNVNMVNGTVPSYTSRPFSTAATSSTTNTMANSVDSYASSLGTQYQQEMQGGTTYFFQNDSSTPSPMVDDNVVSSEQNPALVPTNGCFAYQGPTPHIGKFRPKAAPGNNIAQFISPDLKMELVSRQMAMETKADLSMYPDIPQQVEHMLNIIPLEPCNQHGPTTVYRALSVKDGVPYCIRRIHNFRVQSPKQLQPLENWRKLVHVHIVQLREIIPHTKAFGDSSCVLVYDYHPLADTLKTRHFGGRLGGAGFLEGGGVKVGGVHSHSHGGINQQSLGAGVVETQLWSYAVQLSSALRAIHASGLAARCIDLSKVLIHGKNKLLLSSCGLAELVNPDHQNIQQLQAEDLHAFGRLLLALATGNAFAARRDLLQQSVLYVTQHYSADMKNLITFLLTPVPNSRKSINEIMPMIGARFYAQLEVAQIRNDMLENELSKELENGRLFRLLCKLNTIIERPEHNMDPSWAETGDRFLLKLFRDYVFHQVTESGKPWMDMAHMVHCLNKLDAGVNEKIELVSRDGDNMIIVSYADLRRCIDASFRDLTNASASVVPRH